MNSNFDFLAQYWPDISQLGKAAESYLYLDPNTCISKLDLLSERLVSEIFLLEKIPVAPSSTHSARIKILQRSQLIPRKVADIFFAIQKAQNDSVHQGPDNPKKAKIMLQMAYNISVWFMRVYGDWTFKPSEYVEPKDHSNEKNFAESLRTQEDNHQAITKHIPATQTASLKLSIEDKIKLASDASDKMELSIAETQYLLNEQVRLDISIVPVVNYALQQNKLPIIQSLSIINNSDGEIRDIELCITASPEFALPFITSISYIPANSTYEVKNVSLILNAEYLVGLTEKITGNLHFSLLYNGKPFYAEDIEITALAFHQWHGYAIYPELLVAFVTPNHPEITKLNARAADFLEKWTGDPSLDAYQTQNPDRVKKQAAAVFAALREQNIIYAAPPASFEKIGQRVRLCDAVLNQKMGTCLDLTLLYAACLESLGLHPILILTRGHIFAGVWLDDHSFPESVQDDATVITKRLASGIKEMMVIECTMFTSGKNATFDDACRFAEGELVGEDPVECIIDVTRARLTGITPLPNRILTENGWHIERNSLAKKNLTVAPNNVGERLTIQDTDKNEFSKIALWERKLLDLGLRNSLINMRISSTLIPLLSSSLDDLDYELADGKEFKIYSLPIDWPVPKSHFSLETMHDLGGQTEVISSEFSNKRLRSIYSEEELATKLSKLYRAAKTSLEENGANTLYLALGLLRWYETSRSEKPRYAPVVLIPVDIVRKYAGQRYVLRIRDDDSQMNITMLEKLKQDFHIVVDGLDSLPMDGHGVDTRTIFTRLRKAIMDQTKWEVLESAYLGIFSFSQFVMWNDVRNHRDELEQNKIVKSLIDGQLSWNAEDMEINDRVPEDGVLLPLPADASQLYAIEAATKGESFVLHGPPGTGKSQTITALIANALAEGKTVLFVADKMAALEVVQKRLKIIGIDPFCLELHSNKSKKRNVLEKLEQTTLITKYKSQQKYAEQADHIAILRKNLDSYAISLHKPLHCGETLSNLINSYEEYSNAPDICNFSFSFAKGIGPTKIDSLNILVERLVAAAKECGHPHDHPLGIVQCKNYSQQIRVALPDFLENYKTALTSLKIASKVLFTSLGQSSSIYFADLEKLASHSKQITSDLEFYSEGLYKKQDCGLSLYELLSRYEEYADISDICSFSPKFAKSITETEFERKNELLKQLVSAAKEIGYPHPDPLAFVGIKQPSAELHQSLPILVSAYKTVLETLSNACEDFATTIGKPTPHKLQDIQGLVSIAEIFALWSNYPSAWADAPNTKNYLSEVSEMARYYLDLRRRHEDISKTWDESFFSQNGETLCSEFTTISSKWALSKVFGLKGLLKRVSTYAKVPVQKEELEGHFKALAEYQKGKIITDKMFATYGKDLEHLYAGDNTDWQNISETAKKATELVDRVNAVCNLSYVRMIIGSIRSLDKKVNALIHAWQGIEQPKQDLYLQFGILDSSTPIWISQQLEICNALLNNAGKLNARINWNRVSFEAKEQGLEPILEAYNSEVQPEIIENGYRKALYKSLIIYAITADNKIGRFSDSEVKTWDIANKLRELYALDQAHQKTGSDESLEQIASSMNNAWSNLAQAKKNLYTLLDIVESKETLTIPGRLAMCDQISSHADALKDWITWNSIASEACDNGLDLVVNSYIAGTSHENILNGYKKALYSVLIMDAIDSDRALHEFSGPIFNEMIDQFKRVDKELTELSRLEIYCRLVSKIPNFVQEAAHSSEIGILQRAIRSNGRGMSLRNLFEQIPNLLPRICPCMLMSPISVAQYLNTSRVPFDLVVFDEASQVPTCKAIGALARGKNAVIVGDPKQLPPTSFFTSSTLDEDNLESEDLESILDDCLALNMPQTHLLWHYRSRHESLIAFSNSKFYENRLYTFPSVNDRESKVRLVHVDGMFERGASRVNKEEARAIIEDIKRRCYDAKLSKMSVGVVTFNVQQQALIDDLLVEECDKDPKLAEWAFESEEPIFIKNLENVQGDERDVILFSIGYGPNAAGKVSMNFGPLNRDGGWRRLNVAISRARYEMTVYSTLTPQQLDLSRTSSLGVAALKGFLEYASGQPLSLDENTLEKQHLHTDGIAMSICAILKEYGYKTDLSIGHSHYKIDVGVIDPEQPDAYLLGILLDGESYGSAKTTRDREVAQINVLNDLGWRVVRVWAMDWWDNRQKEVDRILSELKRIQKGDNSPTTEVEVSKKKEEPVSVIASIEKNLIRDMENNSPLSHISRTLYSPTPLRQECLDATSFLQDLSSERINIKIMQVLDHEAPISEGLLGRRVVQSYGISRAGCNIQYRLDQSFASLPLIKTTENGIKYFWSSEQHPETYRDFRYSGEGENKRDAKDVSVIEAANAVCYALSEQFNLSQEDLSREGARFLGYARMGQVVVSLMEQAIKYASDTGRITLGQNDTWVLCEEIT